MILSEFMRTHRADNDSAIKDFELLFTKALTNVVFVFGVESFKRYREKNSVADFENSVSKAVFELEMLSLSFFTEAEILSKSAAIADAFRTLSLTDESFAESLSRATDHRSRFYLRLKLWNAELVKLGLNSDLTAALAKVKE
jgi:hypothetical protein